jgi:hypothetical protein
MSSRRWTIASTALFSLTAFAAGSAEPSGTTTKTPAPVFEKDVAPIVAKCAPCHFNGGVMYAKLPFDKPETIHSLGTRLFSRIKDEKSQAILRRFFESREAAKAASR